MAGCSGNCSSCGGCAKQLTLTQEEIDFLKELGQIPFLPVARKADDMTPVYLEDTLHPGAVQSHFAGTGAKGSHFPGL